MGMARWLIAIALFVGVLVGGWRFASLNSQVVSVNYLIGQSVDVSLWAVLLATFGCGAAVAALVASWGLMRSKLVSRRYRKAVAGLEAEIHQLRNLPLATEEAARKDDALAVVSGGAGQGG